jgi:O-acetyl-ADP-ribose deacetylase (regulator of RNase III)
MYREYCIGHRRLKIFLGDITDLQVDAIVNSENNDLIMDRPDGPSVSAAIRRRAGAGFAGQVAALGPIDAGKAVLTVATGNLPCRYVIHAAVVRRQTPKEHKTTPQILRSSVRSSLEVATALGMKSIAFPAFGVRAAQVPREVSSDLMIEEVTRFLQAESSVEEVIFALLDPESFLAFFERAILRYVEITAPIELSASVNSKGIEFRLGEGGPVASSDIVPYDQGLIDDIGQRFQSLQSAAQRQLVDAAGRLRSLGGFLWNFVLPPTIRDRLDASSAANLVLRLDDSLQGIPIELAWNGRSCLVERFRIGRQVSVQGAVSRGRPSSDDHIAIFCDAAANLPGAHSEGVSLFELFGQHGIPVELRGAERADRAALFSLLPSSRILHWSGHGHCDDKGRHCWMLADGALHVDDLMGMAVGPELVFSNACGRDDDSLLGPARLALGEAFLKMGARHFIGSLWEIDDSSSRHFAMVFYRALVDGRDAGDALRAARASVKERLDGHRIDWAAYVHYGDPRENPLQRTKQNGKH